jgi:hypothetical protein
MPFVFKFSQNRLRRVHHTSIFHRVSFNTQSTEALKYMSYCVPESLNGNRKNSPLNNFHTHDMKLSHILDKIQTTVGKKLWCLFIFRCREKMDTTNLNTRTHFHKSLLEHLIHTLMINNTGYDLHRCVQALQIILTKE